MSHHAYYVLLTYLCTSFFLLPWQCCHNYNCVVNTLKIPSATSTELCGNKDNKYTYVSTDLLLLLYVLGIVSKYYINMLLGLTLVNYFWRTESIFGWSLTWHTGWLDDWYWRTIFGWIITGAYTWIPTWISKYWSWYSWYASGCASWVVVLIWSNQVSEFLPTPHGVMKRYFLGGRYFCNPPYGADITSNTK